MDGAKRLSEKGPEGVKDGLPDQANRFDELLHQVAWTTGTEMIGELGLEMKRMWSMVKARGSDETKESFRSAARLVRKSWPLFRLYQGNNVKSCSVFQLID